MDTEQEVWQSVAHCLPRWSVTHSILAELSRRVTFNWWMELMKMDFWGVNDMKWDLLSSYNNILVSKEQKTLLRGWVWSLDFLHGDLRGKMTAVDLV